MNDRTRFVILACGGQYYLDALRLVASLERYFAGDYSAAIYTDQGGRRDSWVELYPWRAGADGFDKLSVMALEALADSYESNVLCLDADLELIAPVDAAELWPGGAGLVATEHFLDQHESLWGISPACGAWTPREKWAHCYWQTCLWGGFPAPVLDLVQQVVRRLRGSLIREGAWEEPWLCSEFARREWAREPIRTLGVEYCAPVFRPSQNADWPRLYDTKAGGRPRKIQHYNASRRGG